MGETVDWPNWTGWVMALCGIGVLWGGVSCRRSRRQKMRTIAQEWASLEAQRVQVERVFSALVASGTTRADSRRAMSVPERNASGWRSNRGVQVARFLRIAQRGIGRGGG